MFITSRKPYLCGGEDTGIGDSLGVEGVVRRVGVERKVEVRGCVERVVREFYSWKAASRQEEVPSCSKR